MTRPIPTERQLSERIGHEFDHVVCCDDYEGMLAFCGCDVTEEPWRLEGPTTCVVCAELEDETTFCPKYGCCRYERESA